MLTGGYICAYLRCRWGTDSAQCRPKVFGVWTLAGPWNHSWWGPGSLQGKVQFFWRALNTTTSGRRRLMTSGRRPDVRTRRRADEQTTSCRRQLPLRGGRRIDVGPTLSCLLGRPLAIEQKTTFGYMPGGPNSL